MIITARQNSSISCSPKPDQKYNCRWLVSSIIVNIIKYYLWLIDPQKQQYMRIDTTEKKKKISQKNRNMLPTGGKKSIL